MSATKKQYSDDFKRAAVKRFKAGEKAAALTGELHIHGSMLYAWVRKFGKAKKKKVVNKANGHANHDALIYLRHARKAMAEHPDRALDDDVYLFTRLALRSMERRA